MGHVDDATDNEADCDRQEHAKEPGHALTLERGVGRHHSGSIVPAFKTTPAESTTFHVSPSE